MDLLTGGDLRYHIARYRRFPEEQTKFFVACIVVALEYVHSRSILHRDIKPENLVFDDQGYLRVTDFGIARIWNPDNSKETSGTPGYMAPEVMCRQNHGVAVDYFALGVIAYECMMGKVSLSFLSMHAATLCGKVQKGNSRPYLVKAGADQADRSSAWVELRGCRFCKPIDIAKATKPTRT
jgi:serine/threonine protein kinase